MRSRTTPTASRAVLLATILTASLLAADAARAQATPGTTTKKRTRAGTGATAPAAVAKAPLGEPVPAAPPPPARRELRAIWVATVSNIDWPSRAGLPVEQQKAELVALMDRAAALRLNAVIFQVRPAADALYESKLEPWSEYLTGEMGRAPEPFYDPLRFAVEEAHARGLELHAWFNPYRARIGEARRDAPIAASHISRAHPELVRSYGRSLWMDPGERAVQDHSLRVVLDVVRRYDVDGVHIDDYFYPYRERDSATRELLDFPDSASYARYRRAGGTLARDDWRRRNVDEFVRRMNAAVHAAKPWVKVGVSPFGIYRPGQPARVVGLDPYVELYADSRKWFANGWLDYLSPQLYWPVAAPGQSYPALLRWWSQQNVRRRHLWPGLFTSRVNPASREERRWTPHEVTEQILRTRAEPGATGHVHFSAKALMQNYAGLADSLAADLYAEPALVPAS
ncbi:MAG TPA: family 10 glycosylhydrolase, partial [Gemmatimonadaceae bacterium]|nr:family 10 glycosylhydrolase [Gemmatimonadaceae bacterium]